jgi:hypothetical protein
VLGASFPSYPVSRVYVAFGMRMALRLFLDYILLKAGLISICRIKTYNEFP